MLLFVGRVFGGFLVRGFRMAATRGPRKCVMRGGRRGRLGIRGLDGAFGD